MNLYNRVYRFVELLLFSFCFVFFFYENWPKCSLIINAPKYFLFNISSTSFLRPSHVTKIGQIISYPSNSIYNSSLTKKNIEKAARNFLVFHLLIGMMQLVPTRFQATVSVLRLKTCDHLLINEIFIIVIGFN